MNLSELKLTAPKADIVGSGLLHTDEQEVAKQVQLLPYGDIPRALKEALSLVSLNNRTEQPLKQRAKTLGYFQDCFKTMAQHYRPRCGLGTSFIARTKDAEINDFYQFTRELSFGYKELLLQTDEQTSKPEELAQYIYLAMFYLIHGLMQFYDNYKSQPAGTWGEVNRLFKFAESNDLTDITIDNPPIESAAKTINGLYKQILLIAVIDPYHLGRGEIWVLFHYLKHWVSKLKLTQYKDDKSHPSLNINLASNQTAQSNQVEIKTKNAEELRTLDYQKLIDYSEEHLADLKAGKPPEQVGFESDLPPEYSKHILNLAIHFLSDRKDRKHARKRALNTIQTCWSLSKINAYLSHQDLSADSIFPGQTKNESDGGICIELNQQPNAELSVGQLTLVWQRSLNAEQKPKLCVIRWVKSNNQGLPALGLEYIKGSPSPCHISIVKQGSLEPVKKPAILLTHKIKDKKGYTLIVSSGALNPGESFKLELSNQKIFNVNVIELVSQSALMQQFTFNRSN